LGKKKAPQPLKGRERQQQVGEKNKGGGKKNFRPYPGEGVFFCEGLSGDRKNLVLAKGTERNEKHIGEYYPKAFASAGGGFQGEKEKSGVILVTKGKGCKKGGNYSFLGTG